MLRFPFGIRGERSSGASALGPGPGRKRRNSGRRFRLGFEPLEDRALLSTVTVDIFSDSFSPSSVTIQPGDTVHWVWMGSPHSTTSVKGSAETWDSGIQNTGFTYDHTFTKTGSFAYYCQVHGFDNGNGTAGGMSGMVTVSAALQSIAVTPANPTIAKGLTQQFVATGTYSDNSTKDISSQVAWASATPAVASVSAAGLGTALGVGASTISAKLSGVTGSTVLTVAAAALESISVSPANPTVPDGLTQQFSATGLFSDQSTQDLTGAVAWASSATSVATVNVSGLATTVSQGASNMSATLGGVTGSTILTVSKPIAQSIAVTPANPSVAAGDTQQFDATATLSDHTTQDVTTQVTWASATPAVATISAAGLATSVAAGSSSISAKLGSITGSTVMTVTAPVLQTIAVTPANPNVPLGKTQQFTATGTYSNHSTQDLTSQVAWTSSTISVATVSSGGLAAGVTAGTSTITAQMSGVSGSTVLMITPAVLQSISVTPANANIPTGETRQFTATGTMSDQTTVDLTNQVAWTSSAAGVASITAAGLATALSTGGTTISATFSGVTGSTTLSVAPPALTSITVSPANPSIAAGTNTQFTAIGAFSDGLTADLTHQAAWNSDTPAVATISATGLATGLTAGSASISASFDGVSGSTVLTVKVIPLVSITVTPASPSIAKGEVQQFVATGMFSDGSTQDVTGLATWSSDAPAVASISAAGLAAGLTTGGATISALFKGVSGSTPLTVTAAALESLAITPASPTVPKGETAQFTATGTFSDNSTKDVTSQVTWSSSKPAIAGIDASGMATGLGTGGSTISATLGGVSGTTTITVTPAVLQSIAVSPSNASLAKGQSQQFSAIGTLSDQSTENLTSQVAWVSNAPGVANILASGAATGQQTGSATISATFDGITGSTGLSVTPEVLESISVTPANPNVPKGETEAFSATGTLSDATTENLTSQVAWSSEAPAVAPISAAGVASALTTGTTFISAAFGGVTGSTVLTVAPAALISLTVAPTNSSIVKGDAQQFTATGMFSDQSTEDVTSQVDWSSTAPTVASISATGLASTLKTGGTTITASQGDVTASTALTVTPAALVSIVVTPDSANLPQGATRQYTATGMFSDQSTEDLTRLAVWSSTATDAATVSPTGVVTAVTLGSSTIGASFGGLNGTTTVTVTAATLASIAVSPPAGNVPRGETQPFLATGTLTNGTTEDLTNLVVWSSSALNVATISATGLAQTLQSGTTTITAAIGDIHGSATLIAGPTALVSISVIPASASIVKGTRTQFQATGVFSDHTTQDLSKAVVWATSATSVAVINSAGQASAITPGTASITASVAGVTGAATLTVKDLSQLMMIMVSPDGSSILKGQTEQFSAVGMFDDDSTEDLSGNVVWSSGAVGVATVSRTGRVTGAGAGDATITANFDGVMGSAGLTVNPAVLQSIVVLPATATVPKGETQQLSAIGVYSDQSTLNLTNQVTWSSSNPAIASVSATGLAAGLSTGGVTFSAKLGGVSAATSLTVAPAALLSISVVAQTPSVSAGSSAQFLATGLFSDQSTVNLTTFVSWSSTNTGVAAVSPTGVASTSNTGSATIVATLFGVSGSATLAVTVPPNPLFVGTGLAIKASSRAKFNGAVANFKDPNTKPANFLATINWGDNSAPTVGKIRQTAKGKYSASAAHHYTERGTFHVTVTIRDSAGRVINTSSTARIAK